MNKIQTAGFILTILDKAVGWILLAKSDLTVGCYALLLLWLNLYISVLTYFKFLIARERIVPLAHKKKKRTRISFLCWCSRGKLQFHKHSQACRHRVITDIKIIQTRFSEQPPTFHHVHIVNLIFVSKTWSDLYLITIVWDSAVWKQLI